MVERIWLSLLLYLVTNEVGFKRFIRSKLLPYKPVHVDIEVLGADVSMPVVQARFHGAVTVIHSVEMPRSAPPFTSTAIDHFMRSLERHLQLNIILDQAENQFEFTIWWAKDSRYSNMLQ